MFEKKIKIVYQIGKCWGKWVGVYWGKVKINEVMTWHLVSVVKFLWRNTRSSDMDVWTNWQQWIMHVKESVPPGGKETIDQQESILLSAVTSSPVAT